MDVSVSEASESIHGNNGEYKQYKNNQSDDETNEGVDAAGKGTANSQHTIIMPAENAWGTYSSDFRIQALKNGFYKAIESGTFPTMAESDDILFTSDETFFFVDDWPGIGEPGSDRAVVTISWALERGHFSSFDEDLIYTLYQNETFGKLSQRL
ncbi:MAG: hypothetical protein Q9157_002904 [Trypethelium eluteriae]